MRIAFLCKRRYMSKDVILDRYARLYEIPYQLALLGHTVESYCLAYQGQADGRWTHEATPGHLSWTSKSLGRTILPSLLAYPRKVLGALQRFKPDLIIAASDIPHIALGAWLATQLDKPWVADLYDNFEGFGQARIPGMTHLLRRSVSQANLVLTTSAPLRDLVLSDYTPRGEVMAMPSSVDRSVFHPRHRASCRERLGLPSNARLIGTAGGLYREKGIAALYEAWPTLRDQHPDVHLVLAGPIEANTPIPTGERVHYLGQLPHDKVAELFCSLDVGVISILDTPFGRYCFPQKAYEMLSCKLAVVAANVGAMQSLFAQTPECLFRSGDSADLARCVSRQLSDQCRLDIEVVDWRGLITALEPRLLQLVQST